MENGVDTLKLHHDILSKTLKKHCMDQQRLSFLSLTSIENDIVESLTVVCRENCAMTLGIQGRGRGSKE